MNGVRGEVRAETVSGDVDVVETPNLAIAKAVSGDVRARDIGTPTSLTLSTVSGSVIASALKVRTLEAGSVSGNVELTNLDVERLLAKTINGDITADGVVSRGGRYRVQRPLRRRANRACQSVRVRVGREHVQREHPVRLSRHASHHLPGRARSRNRTSRAVRGTFGDASDSVGAKLFGHGRHHEEVAETVDGSYKFKAGIVGL